jgi:hypothetical protein
MNEREGSDEVGTQEARLGLSPTDLDEDER